MPAISGTVTKQGEPLGGAYVRCIGPSGQFVAEIYTADDGAFTFHVADGTWRLEARAAGVETTQQDVTIVGDDAAVTLTV